MGEESIIVNELLTYVNHYINKSNIENIKRITISFYEKNEIIEAKRKIWEIEPSLGEFPERKTSEKRTSAEAHLDDIVDALVKLDNEQRIPIFVAKNVERLPDRQPEELNLLSVINRLSKIEKTIKEHEDTLTCHSIELLDLKDCFQKNEKEKLPKVANIENNDKKLQDVSFHNTVGDMNDNMSSMSGENGQIQCEENADESLLDDFEQFLDWCDLNERDSLSLDCFMKNKNNNSNKMTDNDNDSTRSLVFDTSKLKYSDVTKKNKNGKSMVYSKSGDKRMKPLIIEETKLNQKVSNKTDDEGFILIGKNNRHLDVNTNNEIKGVEPTIATLWVHKIEQGNCLAIKKYLNNRNVRVQLVTRTSHVESKYKSFKLRILKSDVSEVLRKDFWPFGVQCKYWKEKIENKTRTYSNSNIKFFNEYY